jgi:hypothetical protein
MILIGLFNILYNVSYKLYTGALLGEGVGFTMPPKVLEVWNYLANVLANGKAIVSLFLDLPYVYFLVQSVVFMWSAMLVLELIAWIFRLIKLQF